MCRTRPRSRRVILPYGAIARMEETDWTHGSRCARRPALNSGRRTMVDRWPSHPRLAASGKTSHGRGTAIQDRDECGDPPAVPALRRQWRRPQETLPFGQPPARARSFRSMGIVPGTSEGTWNPPYSRALVSHTADHQKVRGRNRTAKSCADSSSASERVSSLPWPGSHRPQHFCYALRGTAIRGRCGARGSRDRGAPRQEHEGFANALFRMEIRLGFRAGSIVVRGVCGCRGARRLLLRRSVSVGSWKSMTDLKEFTLRGATHFDSR